MGIEICLDDIEFGWHLDDIGVMLNDVEMILRDG